MSLPPPATVQKLQTALHTKAKESPDYAVGRIRIRDFRRRCRRIPDQPLPTLRCAAARLLHPRRARLGIFPHRPRSVLEHQRLPVALRGGHFAGLLLHFRRAVRLAGLRQRTAVGSALPTATPLG